MGLGWHPIYDMEKMFETTNQLCKRLPEGGVKNSSAKSM